MASILPIGGFELSFRRDGYWYADEDRIRNPRLQLLFSKHVEPDGEGGWVIDVGVDRQSVLVEDTPLVIRRVDEDSAPNDAEGDVFLSVTANDEISTRLDCATLRLGADLAFSCVVDRGSRGRLDARFTRAAHYQLAQYLVEDPDGWFVCVGEKRFLVPVIEAQA